jgi:alpha-ribazole phosphatase
LRRAVETADALCALGLRPPRRGLEPDFAEQDFGGFDGLTYAEAARRFPEAYTALWRDPVRAVAPEGESFADVVARVTGAAERWTESAADNPVVVVAHAGTLRAALAIGTLTPAQALTRQIRHLGWLVTRAGRVSSDETGSAYQQADHDPGGEEQPVLR